jgi:hypothetical protein
MSDADTKLAEAVGEFIGWIICGALLWAAYSHALRVVFPSLPVVGFWTFFILYWSAGVAMRTIKGCLK